MNQVDFDPNNTPKSVKESWKTDLEKILRDEHLLKTRKEDSDF